MPRVGISCLKPGLEHELLGDQIKFQLQSFILDCRFDLKVDLLLKTKHILELMVSKEAMSLVGGMA